MTPFDIILVPFPFADLSASKQRPCLVLTSVKVPRLGDYLVIAMITSNTSGLVFPHDIKISELKNTGLPKPSLIRLSKMVTLEAKQVRKKLGILSKKDQVTVRKEFKSLFSDMI